LIAELLAGSFSIISISYVLEIFSMSIIQFHKNVSIFILLSLSFLNKSIVEVFKFWARETWESTVFDANNLIEIYLFLRVVSKISLCILTIQVFVSKSTIFGILLSFLLSNSSSSVFTFS
jgi:hypothetical protein